VPDLEHQPALRIEMCRRLAQDAAHQVQTIGAAMQRERRLMAIFRGQRAHYRFTHVRGIGQDQVVAFAGEAAEQVRGDQLHALDQPVLAYVAPRDRQRGGGDVDAGDLRARKRMRGDDGEAAGTGAQIQDRVGGLTRGQPRSQAVAQQFGDVGTRYDDAFVDVEAVFAEPGFVHQIGRGDAFGDAAVEQPLRALCYPRGYRLVEPRGERLEGATQRMHQQPGGFVIGIERAMAVGQAGTAEAFCGSADQLPRRGWRRCLCVHARHLKYK